MSENHRHRRRESRFGAFLRAYLFEIAAAVVVALGLFLLLERGLIRSTLFSLATIGIRSALHVLGHVDNAVADSIARLTLSNAVGLVLVITAVVGVVLRLRWRLVRSASLTALSCPRCSGSIHRVHRRLGDRAVSWFIPVRRYRCSNRECRWSGIRVATSKPAPEPTASPE